MIDAMMWLMAANRPLWEEGLRNYMQRYLCAGYPR